MLLQYDDTAMRCVSYEELKKELRKAAMEKHFIKQYMEQIRKEIERRHDEIPGPR